MYRSLYILMAGIGIGVMLMQWKEKKMYKGDPDDDKYRPAGDEDGVPVMPAGRDSGLSTHISPEMGI